MTWSSNKHFWLTDQTEVLICLRTVRCVRLCVCECGAQIMKSSHCKNRLPQPLAPVGPGHIFYFAERVLWLSPFGALVLFLGRPLNDHCLAVSQIQPSHSLHWAWLNRCQFSHNTLSVPICQPCIVGQHSTVLLTSVIVKLAYTNLVSFLAVFPFRGEGWIWNNKVRCPVARVNKVGDDV